MLTAERRNDLGKTGERLDNAKNSLRREEFEGYGVRQYAERLNAQCDECGKIIYERPLREIESFRNRHVVAHQLPHCVVHWMAAEWENPLSNNGAAYLRRYATEVRTRLKRRLEVERPYGSYNQWYDSLGNAQLSRPAFDGKARRAMPVQRAEQRKYGLDESALLGRSS